MSGVVELKGVVMDFEVSLLGRKKRVRAVDNVTLSIGENEIYGLVGESGSGKSTIGRITLRLYKPTMGRVFFEGVDITDWSERSLRRVRRRMQLIPQDPYSAINPVQTIGEALAEPLIVHEKLDKREALDIAAKALEEVGLVPPEDFIHRKPHELSGGQLQRAVIARSMILRPRYVVADEPTSNLDASIRASIVKLLLDLKNRYGLSMLFITHDIVLLSLIADRIGVLYMGQLVEEGPADKVVKEPLHPYTKALLSAIPRVGGEVETERVDLKGEIGDPSNPPPGCRLHPRCPFATERCRREEPPLVRVNGRWAKCWLFYGK